MPTDAEISMEFAVSRHTARAAVQQLVIDGMVKRYPGKGSFVLRQAPASERWALRSLDDVVERTFGEALSLISVDRLSAGSLPLAAEALQLTPEQQMSRLLWLRLTDGAPNAFCRVYVAGHYGRALPADLSEQLQRSTLISLLEARCGVRAHRMRQETSAVQADPDLARLLGVAPNSPLLLLARIYSEKDGTPIEYSEAYCRPDRQKQIVELSRSDG